MNYLKNLTKMALITSAVISLLACGGGSSSSNPSPTPSPAPAPSPTPAPPLKALTISQDTLNINKVGQHRIWHLTLTNPNSVPVYLRRDQPYPDGSGGNNIFSFDATTPVGPTNPVSYAIHTGSNDCADIINQGSAYASLPLGAGQSCVYTFNALWASNVSNTTEFSFKLNYTMTDAAPNPNPYLSDLTRNFAVKENCVDAGLANSTHCATGTNNPINYSLINLTKKVSFPTSRYQAVFTSVSGDYVWYWTYTDNTSTINRSAVNYNSNTNTLLLQAPNYNYTGNGIGIMNLFPSVDGFTSFSIFGTGYGNNNWSCLNVDGILITGLGCIQHPQVGSVNSIYGLNNTLYLHSDSRGVSDIQPVYTVDQNSLLLQNQLPSPVQFQGYLSRLYDVDTNGNLFGLNKYNGIQNWGCFSKNGSSYNNWKILDENGTTDFNAAIPETRYAKQQINNKQYYTVGSTNYYSFYDRVSDLGELQPIKLISNNYLDIGNCQISKTNYLVEFITGNGQFSASNDFQYIASNKYVLIKDYQNGDNGDYYYLPASYMSNGLDGE